MKKLFFFFLFQSTELKDQQNKLAIEQQLRKPIIPQTQTLDNGVRRRNSSSALPTTTTSTITDDMLNKGGRLSEDDLHDNAFTDNGKFRKYVFHYYSLFFFYYLSFSFIVYI